MRRVRWVGFGVASAAACAAVLAAATPAAAAPGDLDTSFGQQGAATVDLHHNAAVSGLAVQSDGRVVVAGTGISPGGTTTDVVTARFTAQGALDTTYDHGTGVNQPDFGANETADAVALQSDGKIVVAGDTSPTSAGGQSTLLVTRFNADGTQDTTFGGGTGRVTSNYGNSHSQFGRALALQPDGKVVVGGFEVPIPMYPNIDVSVVARADSDGTTDTSFGGRGEAALESETANNALSAVAPAPGGSVLGAGETTTAGKTDFYLVRLTPTSTEFGSSATQLDFGGDDGATAMALLPNGKIVVAGYTDTNGTEDFAIARFNSDLSLDTSFGTNGKTVVDIGGSDAAEAMTIQPDGKIVLVGSTTSGSSHQIGLARLTSGGLPDTTFGHNGISVISFGSAILQGWAVGLQANGDIMVGGSIRPTDSSQRNLLLVRVHGDATGAGSGGSAGGSGSTSGTGTTGGGGSGSTGTTPSGSAGKLRLSISSVRGTTLTTGSNLPKLNPASTPPRGLLVTFSLNVSAKLTLQLTRVRTGQLINGHCRPVAASAHVSHRCTLRRTAATLHYAGHAGVNRFAFAGRLPSGSPLSSGTYTLRITARAGGKKVAATALTLHISGP
jgi:uncharacterized delta-60 repeat protein